MSSVAQCIDVHVCMYLCVSVYICVIVYKRIYIQLHTEKRVQNSKLAMPKVWKLKRLHDSMSDGSMMQFSVMYLHKCFLAELFLH